MIEADDYSTSHSTKAELKFIDTIGQHSEVKARRSALLAGYLDGCFKRVDWGDLDYLTVIAYATEKFKESIPSMEEPVNG